jgi:hypothetical protein
MLIPDLKNSTVEELLRIKMHRSASLRQQLVDMIVADRKKKGMDTSLMAGGTMTVVDDYPTVVIRTEKGEERKTPHGNGVTFPPEFWNVNPDKKPKVLIGPSAFGSGGAPRTAEELAVRLYSTMAHEYQHVLQWQDPARADALGKAGREVECLLWEVGNRKNLGLAMQPRELVSVIATLQATWPACTSSREWRALSATEQSRYAENFQRAVNDGR